MAHQFKEFSTKPYADQGKAFLNAYWNEHQKEAEDIWNWAHKFAELDLDKKEAGVDLDEFNAHRFLESLQETKTVRQMRSEIKEADIDFNKRLALIEYCLWKFHHPVPDFLSRPQGGVDQEELHKAERLLEEVSEACRYAEEKANFARLKEAPFKAAQEELQTALNELKAQEDAYQTRKDDLTKKSQTGGAVQKNKAKAELEIHLTEDPLPLRKAKITTEAAERKADKVREPFRAARQVAEDAEEKARAKLKEAQDYLNELKSKPGQPYGSIWWMDRQLAEKRKYLPGYKK